jgi:hypothetical protein
MELPDPTRLPELADCPALRRVAPEADIIVRQHVLHIEPHNSNICGRGINLPEPRNQVVQKSLRMLAVQHLASDPHRRLPIDINTSGLSPDD